MKYVFEFFQAAAFLVAIVLGVYKLLSYMLGLS